jgi:hypothetical protein
MASSLPRRAWVRSFDSGPEMARGRESAVLRAPSRVWAKLASTNGLLDMVPRINLHFDLDQYSHYFILLTAYSSFRLCLGTDRLKKGNYSGFSSTSDGSPDEGSPISR